MATDNNIENYSAADIEKYHKGLLSAKESHDLEKAALDDPFLADALEGYAVAGVNVSTDINELKNRLDKELEAGKLIAMKSTGKSSFPWLRVAALVIVIAGAGLLAKQFILTTPSKNIARAEPRKAEEIKATGTSSAGTIPTGGDSANKNSGAFVVPMIQNEKTYDLTTQNKKVNNAEVAKSTAASGQANVTTNDLTVTSPLNQPVTPEPIEEKRNIQTNVPAGNADQKEIARDEIKDKIEVSNKAGIERNAAKGFISQANEERQNNRTVAASRKVSEDQNYRNQAMNIFRGRVTDANHVGLPFARVYNPADNNAGTYTDVAGNFNLTYPDSVLTVQVKSVGFENTNVQLRNSVTNNQVILQDDKSLSEVVISNQKPNAAARNREANKTLEEPEPADGWENYDTYLTNNLNVPDELKTRQNATGQVQVSFEVDKNGEPVNIKVEKSLCRTCDKEAIRLIKEGPKWKQNAKNGRTTVTISFDNPL